MNRTTVLIAILTVIVVVSLMAVFGVIASGSAQAAANYAEYIGWVF